jgi:hypothetical protein
MKEEIVEIKAKIIKRLKILLLISNLTYDWAFASEKLKLLNQTVCSICHYEKIILDWHKCHSHIEKVLGDRNDFFGT